ncbi:hypothetical protein CY0110_10997 [Crocosphaera chwakensis CCY0110]|uniref:Uncharacterized protein n=1 Tax=Crocosphaera chwakensis CCY0110 TaxID=391612 RepID=A3IX27_9CHRO|nr:hypothetical protein CY0110_10997 [Crocosphaera chwakensis CCY0110]
MKRNGEIGKISQLVLENLRKLLSWVSFLNPIYEISDHTISIQNLYRMKRNGEIGKISQLVLENLRKLLI